MNTLEELHIWCKEQSITYPEHKDKIIDFYDLAKDEVDSGESLQNEITHCVSSIEELIEEDSEDSCTNCSGSGEGATPELTCTSCGGDGVVSSSEDVDDDYEPDEDIGDYGRNLEFGGPDN